MKGSRHVRSWSAKAAVLPSAAQRMMPSTPCSRMRRRNRSWRSGRSFELARKESFPSASSMSSMPAVSSA